MYVCVYIYIYIYICCQRVAFLLEHLRTLLYSTDYVIACHTFSIVHALCQWSIYHTLLFAPWHSTWKTPCVYDAYL